MRPSLRLVNVPDGFLASLFLTRTPVQVASLGSDEPVFVLQSDPDGLCKVITRYGIMWMYEECLS